MRTPLALLLLVVACGKNAGDAPPPSAPQKGPVVAPPVTVTPPAETDADFATLGRMSKAIDEGDLPALQAFLGGGGHADINEHGTTLLMEAASRKQLAAAKLLVAAHANVNAVNATGLTPLFYAFDDTSDAGAAPEVTSALVHLLVDAGAEVTPKGPHGGMYGMFRMPLEQAARRGDVALVRYLLDKGADAKVAAPDGKTALVSAVNVGSPELVDLMIKHGATPDPKAPRMGDSPIGQAIVSSDFFITKARREGANEAALGELRARSLAVIDLLLAAHADLSIRDEHGGTTLELAIEHCDLPSFTHILDAKPDVEQVDGDGRTALQFLPTVDRPEPDLIALAQLLIARGASKSPPSGATPAEIAAKKHYSKLPKVLR